ncbi:MAG: hypothetical protein M1833_006997 [Piccolia ochrophora]|nr:MAG: hypothetical protein M1833_006997 [Piccolia ochrophora]
MSATSSPLSTLNAARRPGQPPTASFNTRTAGLPQDMQDKMKAFHLSRQGTPPQSARLSSPATGQTAMPSLTSPISPGQAPHTTTGAPAEPSSPSAGPPAGALAGGLGPLRLPVNSRPQPSNWSSAPAVPGTKRAPKPSLGARRGMKLPGGLPSSVPSDKGDTGQAAASSTGGVAGSFGAPDAQEVAAKVEVNGSSVPSTGSGSMFNKFSEFVDTKTGTLKFAGKAVIHGKGIDFSTGSSFSISLDEVDNLEELGKGNYGTVYRVRHSRPAMRKPGLGLAGTRHISTLPTSAKNPSSSSSVTAAHKPGEGPLCTDSISNPSVPKPRHGTTGIIMAMKEIRLELDEAKFAAIIMELDVLHRCVSPFIVDFYGAFFQEGAVYICMEYMDGGSVDKLYGDGVPETILRKITLSTVMGLKSLKEEHNIIHRDVKPTNILVNTRGQVKICDFGVSGNLVASIAKTNIGCQSYMAPERIASGGVAQAGANPGGGTYSVQSDIWSLGLSIIECAMGRYPYAPETYNNIFSQLSAIVDGEPPDLPEQGFSLAARDFVRGCLNKIPKLRPTYAMLLRHAWLSDLLKPPTITEESADDMAASPVRDTNTEVVNEDVAKWVVAAIERRRSHSAGGREKPALHAAPLDAIPSPSGEY